MLDEHFHAVMRMPYLEGTFTENSRYSFQDVKTACNNYEAMNIIDFQDNKNPWLDFLTVPTNSNKNSILIHEWLSPFFVEAVLSHFIDFMGS